jgi:signal peptidase I
VIRPPPEPRRAPEPIVPGLPRDARHWAIEVVQIVVIAALLYLVLSSYVTQPFQVEMDSMEPAIVAGDHVLVDRLSPRWDDYARGEVVVFSPPAPYDGDGVPYIKRVIGLPGDRVQLENGRVYLTEPGGGTVRVDEPYLEPDTATLPQGRDRSLSWEVAEGEYFVLGDNRHRSIDSRTFGPIDRSRIIGRVWVRYLPLDRLGLVTAAR